jgi:hypothetical protein
MLTDSLALRPDLGTPFFAEVEQRDQRHEKICPLRGLVRLADRSSDRDSGYWFGAAERVRKLSERFGRLLQTAKLCPCPREPSYTVGDVVEVDGVNFYARALRCFPRLKPPEPVQTSLTDVFETSKIGMSLGMRLRQIFESSVGADLVNRIRIKFSDVTVVSVARLDLKDALDRQACPEVAPLIDATITAVDRNRKPFFVVSEVLSGKRQATLTLADKANVQAKAERIAQQIGNAEVKVEITAEGLVTLKSELVMPIALKPVTVPKVVLVGQFGDYRGGEQVELKWDPLDCTARPACASLFDPFADLVKESPPSLSEEDLAR